METACDSGPFHRVIRLSRLRELTSANKWISNACTRGCLVMNRLSGECLLLEVVLNRFYRNPSKGTDIHWMKPKNGTEICNRFVIHQLSHAWFLFLSSFLLPFYGEWKRRKEKEVRIKCKVICCRRRLLTISLGTVFHLLNTFLGDYLQNGKLQLQKRRLRRRRPRRRWKKCNPVRKKKRHLRSDLCRRPFSRDFALTVWRRPGSLRSVLSFAHSAASPKK